MHHTRRTTSFLDLKFLVWSIPSSFVIHLKLGLSNLPFFPTILTKPLVLVRWLHWCNLLTTSLPSLDSHTSLPILALTSSNQGLEPLFFYHLSFYYRFLTSTLTLQFETITQFISYFSCPTSFVQHHTSSYWWSLNIVNQSS